jgi:hypothetical protein
VTEKDIQAVERWIAEFDLMVESAAAEAQQVLAGATALVGEVRRLRAALVDLRAVMTDHNHPSNLGQGGWTMAPRPWINRVDAALGDEA